MAVVERKGARLGRGDWIAAALEAIAEGGLAAVAVEPIARRLGVTKGSFYAHFGSRDELIAAALERWEETHGAEGLAAIARIEDPGKRLGEILRTATEFSQSGAASAHVRLLGEVQDPRVRAALARVTESRLGAVASIYRQLGFTPKRAEHRARILYSVYIGLLQLAQEDDDQRLAGRELNAFLAELSAALIER